MFVADLYTGYLFLTDLLNSVQGDCSIRMTALLEYLATPSWNSSARYPEFCSGYLALATPSWISCYNSVAFKSDSSTPLKSLSKMITPSVQRFSKHYPK